MAEPKTLQWKSNDGAKWGPADWYDDVREAIATELALGPDNHWTTGWYGVKKEIVSGRLSCDERGLHVEVSVSDDFDTNGTAHRTIPFTADLDIIHDAFDEVWDEANESLRDNAPYMGFSILAKRKTYGLYVGGLPQGKGRTQLAWVETYIAQRGDGWMYDEPPGDNYSKWGFQEETSIPEEVRQRLQEWIEQYPDDGKEEFKHRGYVVRPWKD
jgi:hypothetical protein